MRERIDIGARSQQATGKGFQDLGAEYRDHVTRLGESLNGASFPWPDQETTAVASLYSQAVEHLLSRGHHLAGQLDVAGARHVTMARNNLAAETAGVEAARRVASDEPA